MIRVDARLALVMVGTVLAVGAAQYMGARQAVADSGGTAVVTGSGHTGDVVGEHERFRKFKVNAHQDDDGSVTGEVRFDDYDAGEARLEVDCALAVDADTVLLSGEITEFTYNPTFVGLTGFVAVHDGGEGEGAIDQITSGNLNTMVMSPLLPEACQQLDEGDYIGLVDYYLGFMAPIQNGNIQVH